jgi:hypothetical protein
MPPSVASVLGAWSNFEVIIGSAAAGLTGLMFVVITLVRRSGSTGEGIGTFSTPTVVHFGAVLFISAVLSAPWPAFGPLAVVLAVASAAGIVYAAWIMRRTNRLSRYQPDSEDWIWYAILPFVAYAIIFVCAVLLVSCPRQVLFALGGASLLLIFIGIHNAWDVVTYIAFDAPDPPDGDDVPT